MSAILADLPTATSVGSYFIANYPPFSCWKSEHIPKLIHALSTAPQQLPLGLYVHVPFCQQRCNYCYFRTYARRMPEAMDFYIESVLRELKMYQRYPALELRPFTSVYFGGGSPSYLSAEQIKRLLSELQEISPWDASEECTFECEPSTVTPEKLRVLKQERVTRLSLGFQTLTAEVLRRAGRDVMTHDCFRSFIQAREAGFKEINIDLLAGLEGETDESWLHTIDRVLELQPDCITMYQFELPYNSSLYRSMKTGRSIALPNWKQKREMVRQAFELLENSGYTVGSGYMAIKQPLKWRFVYTVENFWHGSDLLGLGESAFGMIHGVHYQNLDRFEAYTTSISHGKLPLGRALKATAEQRLRREVILQLKTGYLNASYFREKYRTEIIDFFEEPFAALLQDDLISIDGDDIRLSREGLLAVDWLLPLFYQREHIGIRYT